MPFATFSGAGPREGAQFLPKVRRGLEALQRSESTLLEVRLVINAMAGECLNVDYRTLLAACHVA